MSYLYEYRTKPLFWVHYIGTSNGAYIRASNHNSAKWIFAKGEGLNSIAYLKSTQKHSQQ
jgi:hypothetical protein